MTSTPLTLLVHAETTAYDQVGMWVWIALGAAAIVLLAIALFRARRGWSTGRRPRTDGQAEARTAAWLDKGPPSYQ